MNGPLGFGRSGRMPADSALSAALSVALSATLSAAAPPGGARMRRAGGPGRHAAAPGLSPEAPCRTMSPATASP